VPVLSPCVPLGLESVIQASKHRSWQASATLMAIELTVTRLECLNHSCYGRTFAGSIPKVTGPRARWTSRLSEIVRQLGRSAGGRPSERLLARFGKAVSGDTVLCARGSRSK